jgi:ornithine carbamoyltransferase
MPENLHGRSVLALDDFSPSELHHLLTLAKELKAAKQGGFEKPQLTGKNIVLIFEKDSTARVLGRMFDAIEFRGFAQADVETLSLYAGVPVYNGLTEDSHPTQILADFMTMLEYTHKNLSEIKFAFLGDGHNNMARSLAVGAAKMGMNLTIGAPPSRRPNADFCAHVDQIAKSTGAVVGFESNAASAVHGADFIYTDVWLLKPYQVNKALMEAAGNPAVRFMHCLPSFHNAETVMGKDIAKHFGITAMEVTDEVFESPASIVFDQAENRMHSIKAILIATLR